SSLHESGVAISIDLARDPHNVDLFRRLTETYGDSSAALVLLESELARQALKPTRLASFNGSGLPLSFSGVNENQAGAPLGSQPDIGSIDRGNRRIVEKRVNGAQQVLTPRESTDPLSALRDHVVAGGSEIRSLVRTADQENEEIAGTALDRNGTLVSP